MAESQKLRKKNSSKTAETKLEIVYEDLRVEYTRSSCDFRVTCELNICGVYPMHVAPGNRH